MTTELTYVERSGAMDAAETASAFKRIESAFKDFQNSGKRIGENLVSAVNTAREIGLHLQGIAGGEQMGFGFFQTHCANVLPFGFQCVRHFISIARKVPKPITTAEEAVPVMQQVYFAAELLELPEHRDGPQKSHEQTPVVFVFSTLGTAWEAVEKRITRDVDKMDDDTRTSVRQEIERWEKKLAELKAKL